MEPRNRTVPDDGFILCYDCGGVGICTNCEGSATIDGELCSVCSGRRYCFFCKGTGQVRPQAWLTPKREGPLVARSADECRLYIELNPHELDYCNERQFPARARIEKTDRGLMAIYEAECPRCHKPRRLEFLLDPELPPPPPAFGGAKPSAIIDPGEFVYAADEAAKRAPYTLAPGFTNTELNFAREKAAVAVAAIEEVFKFIPPDKNAPPASTFKSEIGTALFVKNPARFTRPELQERLEWYRKVLAEFDRELAKRASTTTEPTPSTPAHLTDEDKALVAQMLANRDKRKQREAEQGRKPPLPADSPIFKKWERDGFMETAVDDSTAQDIAEHLKALAGSDPGDRVYALRALAQYPIANAELLAACERLLDDRTIATLTIPYTFGEVRWLAASAVAAIRGVLGRKERVVIEDAFAPVAAAAVGQLAAQVGIHSSSKAGVQGSIETLEMIAAAGKLPRRRLELEPFAPAE